MAIREGAWDCPFCGMKRNRGPEKFCGGCGAPRSPEVRFYLPEDAREVDDPLEQERARAGPDWSCAFCGGDNKGWNGFCTGCGSAREAGSARAQVQHGPEAPRTAEEAAARALPSPPPPAPPAPSRGSGPLARLAGGCGALGCLALLALVLLLVFLSGTHEESFRVTGAHWERVVSIERQVPVQEQAWSGAVPPGARELSRRQEVRSHRKVQIGSETRTRSVSKQVPSGTERVKVGTKDMGNGYFEDVYETRTVYRTVQETERYQEPIYREEPVYDVRITYEVQKWQEQRQARASGEDTQPRWPDADLAAGEREGARTEKYSLAVTDPKGKTLQYEPKDAADFQRFQVGSTCRGRVNRLGSLTALEP